MFGAIKALFYPRDGLTSRGPGFALHSRTPGAVVSRAELLEHLYGYNWERFGSVVKMYISGLGRKLDDVSSPQLIHTTRGQEYFPQDLICVDSRFSSI
jgi:hypothetical protein